MVEKQKMATVVSALKVLQLKDLSRKSEEKFRKKTLYIKKTYLRLEEF